MSAARTARINAMIALKPFKGTISGISGASWSRGEMPAATWASYRLYADAGKVAFTILSYATPIAWVTTDGEVIMPQIHYSVTTSSRHMPEVHEAYGLVKSTKRK